MDTAPERVSLIAELEVMQNDLLARLDELDQRVCRAITEWTSLRPDAPSSPSQAELN